MTISYFPYEGINLLTDPADALDPATTGGIRDELDVIVPPQTGYLGKNCTTRWHAKIVLETLVPAATVRAKMWLAPPTNFNFLGDNFSLTPQMQIQYASSPQLWLPAGATYSCGATVYAPGSIFASAWTILYNLSITCPDPSSAALDCIVDFTHTIL